MKELTRTELLDELAGALRTEFEGYTLPNKDGEMQQVKVFTQYLPQPQGITYLDKGRKDLAGYEAVDYESNFPCLIVRLEDMSDREEGGLNQSLVKVKVVAGVYDESTESQGYRYILAMQDKARMLLLDKRVIGRKYLLDMPMTSRLLDSESWPVWYGEQEMTYHTGRPLQNWEYIHGGMKP